MLTQKENIVFTIIAISLVIFCLVSFVVSLIVIHYRSQIKKNDDILKAVYEGQEGERLRIAQELHDDIGAKLSALKLQNEMLIDERDLNLITKFASKNASSINQIVKDIRVISRNQSSEYIEKNGIVCELEQLKKQFVHAKNIQIIFDINLENISLNKRFEVNLFRVVQELMHNSIKHSSCTEINLKIYTDKRGLTVRYSDDGKGFEPQQSKDKGMGLKNITTRINLFKGNINFDCSQKGITYNFFFDAKHAFEKTKKV